MAHRVHIHLCAAGQADEEVEDKQTGNESLSVVLDDRILVAQRRNDRLRTSELEQIHTHSLASLCLNRCVTRVCCKSVCDWMTAAP